MNLIPDEDGTLFHDPECTGCDHDCPHRNCPPAWRGAGQWCQTCDDHYEATPEEGDEEEAA